MKVVCYWIPCLQVVQARDCLLSVLLERYIKIRAFDSVQSISDKHEGSCRLVILFLDNLKTVNMLNYVVYVGEEETHERIFYVRYVHSQESSENYTCEA